MVKRTEACRGGVSPLGAVLPPALYAGADITGGFPMIYNSDTLEREALLDCARRMCAAARTAPSAPGGFAAGSAAGRAAAPPSGKPRFSSGRCCFPPWSARSARRSGRPT